MKTVSLNLEDELADRLNSLEKAKQEELSFLLQEILYDPRSLDQIMKDMSSNAARKGLTSKKLKMILHGKIEDNP